MCSTETSGSRGNTLFGGNVFPITTRILAALGWLFFAAGCSNSDNQPTDISAIVRSGNKSELMALIRGGEDLCGGKEEFALVQAAFELRTGKFDRSLREIATVDPKGRFRNDALWIAGESLYRQGNIGAAIPLLSTLSKEFPNHLQGRKCLAAVYYDLGAMDYAELELRHACELDPSDHRPFVLLGRICLDFAKYHESIDYFKKSIEHVKIESEREEIERGLARAMTGARTYEDLLSWAFSTKNDPTIETCKAEALWSTGKGHQARLVIDEILSKSTAFPSALLLSAKLHSGNSQPALAIQELNAILESDRHNVRARHQLAMAYKQIGDDASFQTSIQLRDESQKLMDELLALSTDVIDRIASKDVYDRLSFVSEQLGKNELAAKWREVANGVGGGTPAPSRVN